MVLILAVFLSGFSSGSTTITTQRLEDPSEVSGTFTVIFYGKAGYSDPVTAVFLDREGDEFELVPRAPSWAFERKTGVDADDALAMAKAFVKDHRDFHEFGIRKILSPNGNPAGIEVRALYDPTVYGVRSDLLWIQYWTENGRQIYFTVSGGDKEGNSFPSGLPRLRD